MAFSNDWARAAQGQVLAQLELIGLYQRGLSV